MRPVISLLTDFGLSDGYVGTMHGVILGICPDAQIVDLSHDIAPQNVPQAAWVAATSCPYFPPGTVHVIVVDPGVGSERRAIAVRTANGFYVAPDNGVLSYVLAKERVLAQVSLDQPRYWLPDISQTFHGRDILAPVGAHLGCGVPLAQLGTPIGDLIRFDMPGLQHRADGTLVGRVLYIDHFGNLITDIPASELSPQARIRIGQQVIEMISPSYAAVGLGQLVALVSSANYIEIAVRNGSAAAQLGAQVGEAVVVEV